MGDGPECPEASHAPVNLYVIAGIGTAILWCPFSNAAYAAAVFNETTKQFEAGAQLRQGVKPHGNNAGTAALPSVSAEPLAGDD